MYIIHEQIRGWLVKFLMVDGRRASARQPAGLGLWAMWNAGSLILWFQNAKTDRLHNRQPDLSRMSERISANGLSLTMKWALFTDDCTKPITSIEFETL